MKKFAFVIYRQWAFDIYTKIVDTFLQYNLEPPLLIVSTSCEFVPPLSAIKIDPKSENELEEALVGIDYVFFYGWSWIISAAILSKHICLCLHPSRLPEFRGGSPIQNQIINGVNDSAITIFKMDDGIDSGPIYKQLSMSLEGTVDNIFYRMVELGVIGTNQLIHDIMNDELKFKKQENLNLYPPLKRRKMSDSKIEDPEQLTFTQLNDRVRSLTGPYPRAYYELNDTKLYIDKVIKRKQLDSNAIIINIDKQIDFNKKLYFKVSDGYAEIIHE